MNFKVSKVCVQDQNNSRKQQKNQINSQTSTVPLTNFKQKKQVDSSCDGKFSYKEAGKNFAKGMVAPITGMFESKKSFAIGALTVIGSVALIAATGGAAAPLLVAAGVGMGVFQAGKAVQKISKAQNGDDIEKAFFDIGEATSTIGLSVAGAKGALKQGGVKLPVNVKGKTNALKATKECITQAPKLVNESYLAFKSGYYKRNISNAITKLTIPRSLSEHSKNFAQEAKANINDAANEVKTILPENIDVEFCGRGKSRMSIYEKLKDDLVTNRKNLAKIKNDKSETPANRAIKIKKIKENINNIETDENYVKTVLNDLIGTRFVLKDVSKQSIDEVVAGLITSIKDKKIKITEIRNYRGPDCEYYFSEAHINQLKAAARDADNNLTVKFLETEKKSIKESGYTAVQVKIIHKNGSLGELQIRGKEVNELAELEHLVYDSRTGKDIARGNNYRGAILRSFERNMQKLPQKDYNNYLKYLSENYKHAMNKEKGIVGPKPELPANCPSCLSVDNLQLLHDKVDKIKLVEKDFYSLLTQIAFLSGSNGIVAE